MYTPENLADTEVASNRQRWLAGFGISPNEAVRVYITYDRDDFTQYRSITKSDRGQGMHGDATTPRDALATNDPSIALFLPIADCVGTVLYDPVKQVLMLSHLGRHSLEQNGGQKSVAFLVDKYGTDPHDLQIWMTPAPNQEVYPIFKLNNKGLVEAAIEQLQAAGVQPNHITASPFDTATDPNYFSHSEFLKGNKPTNGRFAIIARLPQIK